MMHKNKFTADPQLDSEGFTVPDARCRGCSPDEMCPRSGHCERYDSPLRWCEPCTSYHHPDAPGCFAKNPPTDVEIKKACAAIFLERKVHSIWLRNGRSE